MGTYFWRLLVFHYECYSGGLVFRFHIYLMKKTFVQFYYSDIFDGCYIVNIDEMIYVVVHDNPWWDWLLNVKYDWVLGYFQ